MTYDEMMKRYAVLMAKNKPLSAKDEDELNNLCDVMDLALDDQPGR
ncbi:MAG: hypothetical protein HOH04_10610 [Rhodospirillaceae bacterium]|jgi:hypothetical protein|nr:hypothetical protein [Rhodospirillaceae bacterium]